MAGRVRRMGMGMGMGMEMVYRLHHHCLKFEWKEGLGLEHCLAGNGYGRRLMNLMNPQCVFETFDELKTVWQEAFARAQVTALVMAIGTVAVAVMVAVMAMVVLPVSKMEVSTMAGVAMAMMRSWHLGHEQIHRLPILHRVHLE